MIPFGSGTSSSILGVAAADTSLARPLRVASMAEAFVALEELATARPLLFHHIGTFTCTRCDHRVHCVETVSADAAVWRLVFFAIVGPDRVLGRAPSTARPLARAAAAEMSPACIGTWHFCPDFPLDLKAGDGRRIAAELAPGAAASHWVRPEEQALRIASLMMDSCDCPGIGAS